MDAREEPMTSENVLSEEQKAVLNSFEIPNEVDVEIQSENDPRDDVKQMNESFIMTRKIYESVLAPQLEKNEDLKREQKEKLVDSLFKILRVQFRFTYIYVLALIFVISFSAWLGLSENLVLNVMKFMEFYITSIVAELIAILFFIVKSVFDKSIVELIKDFDKRNK